MRGNHRRTINSRTIYAGDHSGEYGGYVSRNAVSIRRARVCQLQRNFIILLGAVLFLICGILLGSGFLSSSRSNASDKDSLYKYYTSIEVSSGDTLWTIAEKYADGRASDKASYIQEIREMNHLQDDTIHAGDYLTIAYYSHEFK
ncbi:MAG: LysM peptidoglycan-binding domain-containing protein [Lachnospiraceae bacterium]|nr:LysM peptidoglycan-binding domain-containing protein [Lachnospiraceae bacterium]